MKRIVAVGTAVVAVIWLVTLWTSPRAEAAEGAASNYVPGLYGDVAVATPPDPGFYLLDFNYFYSANVNRTILEGRANADLKIKA